ncbi:hypothetical protein BTUL_0088g00480 [Botrytis tulipae]|uniref:Uncharacterized protein n=1 Tax=Botrytis tulipae TaxID=87230 RepID=A0A4Z1ETH6_9HELO|nr:hypothetical protein BTUL_0088g00480 [Botrytis tulipae]
MIGYNYTLASQWGEVVHGARPFASEYFEDNHVTEDNELLHGCRNFISTKTSPEAVYYPWFELARDE